MEQIGKLLEEYKLCQNTPIRLEETICKTSASLSLRSVGTFVLIVIRLLYSARFHQANPQRRWPKPKFLGY